MTDSARITVLELAVEAQQTQIKTLLAANERQAAQLAALLLTRSGVGMIQPNPAAKPPLGPVRIGTLRGLGGPVGKSADPQWTNEELELLKRKFAQCEPLRISRLGGLVP